MTDQFSKSDDNHALLIEEMTNRKKNKQEQCWLYTYRWELLLLLVLAFAALYYIKTSMHDMFDFYSPFQSERAFDYDLGLDKYKMYCDSDYVKLPLDLVKFGR